MTAALTGRIDQIADPEKVSRRTRQIVEGALLADITVVLLLGRVYLPIPVVRTVWRLVAAAPFVLLAERQGIKITVMAGLVSYLLLSALIGPTLALTALDTAFAAILIALAEVWRWPRWITVAVMGLIYSVCDIVVPTILFAILFRLPASTLVGDARTTTRNVIRILASGAKVINRVIVHVAGPGSAQIPIHSWQALGYDIAAFVFDHWVIAALIAAAIMGLVNVAAYKAATDLVLSRVAPPVRLRQARA